MKKLFICRTPMQIIIAFCIKKQYLNKDDKVDLIITDTFNNYKVIASRIRKLKIFDNVYDFKIFMKNKAKKLQMVFNIKKYIKLDSFLYSEMYFWNYDYFSASLRACLYKENKNIKTFLFEEAYTIYFPYKDIIKNYAFLDIINFKNKYFHNNLTRNNINGLFMLNPTLLLYKSNCPIYKIESLVNSKDFKDLIDYTFNASRAVKNYDKKYIIFEEAMYANDPDIDDEKIFDEIINIVGKDNVIIKLHPRTIEDRFTKKGIKTLGNDGIPWEALACVGDFSDKVFITISSGSIPTYKTLFGNKINAFMLFKFIKPKLKAFNPKYYKFWDKFSSVTKDGGIHLPESEDEFYEELKKEVKKNEKKN